MKYIRVPLEEVQRLNRDLRKAAGGLSAAEVRYLVDSYYMIQEQRKRAENQVRALAGSEEPHELLTWLAGNAATLEGQLKSGLDAYSRSQPLGRWVRTIMGIGPVIAAGLLAHIDLEKAPTVGHIWRFAGLDPTSKWAKGQKRPWNASLKVLCWKIGESFVKVSGKPEATFGQHYVARKAIETDRNERLEYADQAAQSMKRVGKNTECHAWNAKGMLSPGHIHARAKRWAVKLFLAAYHAKGREMLGLPVPLPYPVAHLGHAHVIEPPK